MDVTNLLLNFTFWICVIVDNWLDAFNFDEWQNVWRHDYAMSGSTVV